jgi:heme-degrading monooxygenase HmoA
MAEATIRPDADVMTLINVFTVAPDKQQELIDLLTAATGDLMSTMPGFVSASIHRSDDGRHVINYAQWRSREDFEAVRQDERVGPHMARAAALAQFEPIVCDVVFVARA